MKNFYKELPENFTAFKTIDAKEDKKVIIKFNILNILLIVIAILPFISIIKNNIANINSSDLLLFMLIFLVSFIIYIILHELTHGLVYKMLTKEKLTFGITLTVAFCGVPHIYVSKKTALLSCLAPFVIYSIIFIALIFIVPSGIYKLAMILLFASHFGGCIGDLWVSYILLTNKGDILMNDTGPKQTFYHLEK